MSTAAKVTALIAACALGVVMVVGLAWDRRDAAQTLHFEQQAKLPAAPPQMTEGAPKVSGADPSRRPTTPTQIAAPAPSVDSTVAKSEIITVVTPWIEIARRRQYVQASPAERKAIRDLYWHLCVEERIPVAQRTSAYWQFVRDWDTTESGVSEDSTGTPSMSQFVREQQASVPLPVNAETMRGWCSR